MKDIISNETLIDEIDKFYSSPVSDSCSNPYISQLRDIIVQISLGYQHSCILTFNGYVACWGYNLFNQLINSYKQNNNQIENINNQEEIVGNKRHREQDIHNQHENDNDLQKTTLMNYKK